MYLAEPFLLLHLLRIFFFFSFPNPHETTSSNPPILVIFTVFPPPPPSWMVIAWLLMQWASQSLIGSRVSLSLCGWNSSIWLLWHHGARALQPRYHGILPSIPYLSLTAGREDNSTAGQTVHRLLAKPGPLDTVLKGTVVGACCNHTPEPKQFEEKFSGGSFNWKRLNT